MNNNEHDLLYQYPQHGYNNINTTTCGRVLSTFLGHNYHRRLRTIYRIFCNHILAKIFTCKSLDKNVVEAPLKNAFHICQNEIATYLCKYMLLSYEFQFTRP